MSGVVSVKAECLPFAQIPHTTRLFADYLAYRPAVREFYPRSPQFAEWVKEENPASRYDAGRREAVAKALARQNKLWGASEKTLGNIERLRGGASVVVTGQQVGLFGGPMFAMYKALTAVKLANEANAAGVDAVPVFWLATNDHDLAEVNHAWLAGLDGTRRLFSTTSRGMDAAPVGTIAFGPEIEPVVAQACDLLGESDLTEALRAAYVPGETFGSAFAKLYARLFAEWGVVLLDPCQPDLQQIAAPMYARAIEQASALDTALLGRGKELEGAGYHQQVKVTPSSTLLFTIKDGARTVIHRRVNGGNGNGFSVGDERVSGEELLRRIGEHPENFSPNVLLRPVVQDYLLPTLAYTAGSAEIAYFAQVGVVYEALLGHVTPVVPRYSATLIEQKDSRLLAKYGVGLVDVLQGPEALRERCAQRTMPSELQASFARANQALEASFENVREGLAKLDPTLVAASERAQSKMRYQLKRLQGRAARAKLGRDEVLARHAAQLSDSLFPDKVLQERQIAGISFVARHGQELLEQLLSNIHTDCHDHQAVTLD
jgi:bacillithiol biosynthesis cysteine-adding enzyme BshC